MEKKPHAIETDYTFDKSKVLKSNHKLKQRKDHIYLKTEIMKAAE